MDKTTKLVDLNPVNYKLSRLKLVTLMSNLTLTPVFLYKIAANAG